MNDSKTFDIMKMAHGIEAKRNRKRIRQVMAGAALAALGLIRGGKIGPLVALGGAALMVRGVADVPLRDAARKAVRSVQRVAARATGDLDSVDEASLHSFPASDPPAHSRA